MLSELKEDLFFLKVNAVSNILRSTSIVIKLVWLFFLVAAAGICAFLIVGSIREYLHYPVTTTVRVYSEQKSIFPTVSICQLNPLSTDYVVSLLQEAKIDPWLLMRRSQIEATFYIQTYLQKNKNISFSDEQKQKLSDFDQRLISCSFDSQPCNASDFQWIWDPYYGSCHRFNSDASKHVWLTQKAPKLTVQLYSGMPNYISQHILLPGSKGFVIFIQNHTDYPFNVFAPQLQASSGFGLNIHLTRTFHSQFNEWPYKYSECRVGNDNELLGGKSAVRDPYLYELVVQTNYRYTREACTTACLQNYVMDMCNCSYGSLNFAPPQYPVCLSETEYTCANTAICKFILPSFPFNDKCLASCPLECNRQTFEKSYFYYNYPTYWDFFRNRYLNPALLAAYSNQTDFTLDLFNNLVEFSVNYDSLSYTKIEEKATMTFEDLFGALGGHLHLFLGMSLISFVELVDLFVKLVSFVVYNYLFNKKRNNN